MTRREGFLWAAVRNQRGTAVIELGLAAPLLILFLVAIVDLTGCFTSKFALRKAVNSTLQLVSVKELTRDYSFARATAAAAAGVPLANVTYDAWLECDTTRMPSINSVCDDGEEVKRFISLTIQSEYALSFPYSYFAAADGAVDLVASSTMRLQ